MAGGGGGGGHKGGHHAEEHEEHVNHEAWVIPYADMLTLLMALFLMLYAISSLDIKKFEELARNLNAELLGGSGPGLVVEGIDTQEAGPGAVVTQGGEGILEGAQPAPVTVDAPIPDARAVEAEEALVREEQREVARAAEDSQLAQAEQAIAQQAEAAGLATAVRLRREARGLIVSLASDQILFAPGSAHLEPDGRRIVGVVAQAIRGLPNRLAVEGHTDSRPISTPVFPTNWELSTARATSVLRELIAAHGIDGTRVAASGYADTKAVGDNATPEGRSANRRVEIVVLSELAEAPAPPG